MIPRLYGIILSILILGAVVVPHITSNESTQTTILYVGGSGPGNYTTIQSAIDASLSGYTIFVYNGTYTEHLLIDKTITIIGEDKNNTILQNTKDIEAIQIIADQVNISNIFIDNTDKNNVGINIFQVSHCCICSVKVIRCYGHPGILIKKSDHTLILNTSISWCGGGISIANSKQTTIQHNHLYSNDNNGLSMIQSSSTWITNNQIYWNAYEGIYLFEDNQNNIISNNTITQNLIGIYIHRDCPHNQIYGNTINNNDIGIQLHEVHKNSIFENDIKNNIDYGLRSISNQYHNTISKNNIIYHNKFINNGQNAYDEGNNIWDNGHDSWGNYWDDYTGEDLDSNGIGDTPYEIPGGENKDFYPLSLISVKIIDVIPSFGKIIATIKTGNTSVDCSILIDGCILIGENETSYELPSWSIETIQTPFTFGFFKVNIIVTANEVLKKYDAFLFGSFFINFKEKYGI